MAVIRGPRIVTDKLVLCLDAGDKNSCLGQTATNLLTYTDTFASSWAPLCGPATNVTYNTTDVTAPDGTNTAAKIVRSANITCNNTEAWGLYYNPAVSILSSTGTYTVSFYARGAKGGESLDFGLNDTHIVLTQYLTTNWVRYYFTFTNISDTSRGFQFRNRTGNCTYYIWGPQTVQGGSMGPFVQSVGTSNGLISTTWKDLSGNNNNATVYGPVQYINERNGCFDFSSVTGATSAAASLGFTFASNMVPTSGNFTFSTWIKNPPNTVGQSGLFSNAGSGDGYRFGIGKNGVYYLIGNSGGFQEGTINFLSSLNSTDWYNVTTVYGTSESTPQIRVYLNGKLQNSVNLPTSGFSSISNATPGMIRSPCCTPNFNGKLSSFYVYNKSLSAQEIYQNYLAGFTRYNSFDDRNQVVSNILNNINSVVRNVT